MATSSTPRKSAAKASTKATVKTAAKTVAKTAVRTAPRLPRKAPASPPATAAATGVSTTTVPPARVDKPRKPKLVRDSFTIPKIEYTVLQELKQRAGRAGTAVKKSELLRAGIKALAAMNDAAFAAALDAVPPIKTGRPARQ